VTAPAVPIKPVCRGAWTPVRLHPYIQRLSRLTAFFLLSFAVNPGTSNKTIHLTSLAPSAHGRFASSVPSWSDTTRPGRIARKGQLQCLDD